MRTGWTHPILCPAFPEQVDGCMGVVGAGVGRSQRFARIEEMSESMLPCDGLHPVSSSTCFS